MEPWRYQLALMLAGMGAIVTAVFSAVFAWLNAAAMVWSWSESADDSFARISLFFLAMAFALLGAWGLLLMGKLQ